MSNSQRTQAIVDQLNAYDVGAGDNIWQDVILVLPEYDEARTDEIDAGDNTQFALADGTEIEYIAEIRQWQVRD